MATAFTWDDVKTESALLYCPHSVHLIIAALYEPKDKSLGVTHRMCYGCICVMEGVLYDIILEQQCRQQGRSVRDKV